MTKLKEMKTWKKVVLSLFVIGAIGAVMEDDVEVIDEPVQVIEEVLETPVVEEVVEDVALSKTEKINLVEILLSVGLNDFEFKDFTVDIVEDMVFVDGRYGVDGLAIDFTMLKETGDIKIWNDVVSANMELCKTIKVEASKLVGEDVTVKLSVINDLNKDNALFTSINGIEFYNAWNE